MRAARAMGKVGKCLQTPVVTSSTTFSSHQNSNQEVKETMAAPQSQAAVDMMAEFQAGVTAALRSWSALRTAVETEWGGAESHAKAEDLRANILSQFDTSGKPKMQQEELEDNLADYMEEEFSVVLEDGSERQLADVIYRMYEACAKGDVTLCRQVVANAQTVVTSQPAQKAVVQTEGELDEDDDDDNMGSSMQVQTAATAASYASEGLFGPVPTAKPQAANVPPPRQLGEAAPEKPQVEVDDDGFAAVAPRKGRRGR